MSYDINGLPVIGTRWRHKNGNYYYPVLFTNLSSTKEEYPPTIVYRGENMKTWSRPLSRWEESMVFDPEIY